MGNNIGSNLPYTSGAPFNENEIASNFVGSGSTGGSSSAAANVIYADSIVGIDNSGAADNSSLIISAISSLPSGKGAVIFGAGTYLAQGLPYKEGLYYIGQGAGATFIKLKSSPTNHLFVSSQSGSLYSGGIIGCSIWSETYSGTYGSAKSIYNGIDLYSIQFNRGGIIDACEIAGFTCGIRGSQSDEYNKIRSNQFHDNVVGYYVQNNHPEFQACNFFFGNNYGIGSLGLYDCNIVGHKFYSNLYGIGKVANDGRSGSLTSTITAGTTGTARVSISSCQFDNTSADIQAGYNCTITQNNFLSQSGTKAASIKIDGDHVKVNNNHFADSGVNPITACIQVNNNANGSAYIKGLVAVGNTVEFTASGAGGFMQMGLASGKHLWGALIQENACYINSGTGYFYDSVLSSGNCAFSTSISKNRIYLVSGTLTKHAIYMPEAGNRLGNIYDGNLIRMEETTTGNKYHIYVGANDSNIVNNICENPYNATVTITFSGTTATVTHNGHGFAVNDYVGIQGATGADGAKYNGNQLITGVTTNTYTYTMSGTPGANAAGTIRAGRQGIWLTNTGGYYGSNIPNSIATGRDSGNNLIAL